MVISDDLKLISIGVFFRTSHHIKELSLHPRKTALTLDHPVVLPPALSSTRAAAAVLIVTVAAVPPLRVPASRFDLVQRSQFGDGFALQKLAAKRAGKDYLVGHKRKHVRIQSTV